MEYPRTRQSLSLIMLDVDHFKQYNDSYGHLVGDEVLTTLCWTMKQHIKTTDFVGRWGGEEFVIALPDATAEQAQQIALRVRQTDVDPHSPHSGRKDHSRAHGQPGHCCLP